MRRALPGTVLVLAVAATLFGSTPGSADSYCFRSGIYVGDEPWLAHEECLDCPTEDCPPVPDLPEEPDDSPIVIEIWLQA